MSEVDRPAPAISTGGRDLVFFDGECALCDHAVRLLLRLDRHERLAFAPLHGATARHLAVAEPPGDAGSILFFPAGGGAPLRRSRAVVAILRAIGGPCRLAGALLRLLPTALADRLYDVVAWGRRRWFGPVRACSRSHRAPGDRLLP